MPNEATADIGELLRRLTQARVEFIVVGGAAAVLHGAPLSTEDLDIVHRRTPDNVARLLAALADLGAVVRELADRRLPPSESALKGEGHVLLTTVFGPLDCLGALVGGLGYEQLLPISALRAEIPQRPKRMATIASSLTGMSSSYSP